MSRRSLLLFAVAALVAASCGGGGGDDAADATAAPTTVAADGDEVVVTPTGAPEVTEAEDVLVAWPLSGAALDDVADAQRPALVAKIDNVEAARPQAGLNQADVVVEEIVEGGLTRLLAVFHSQDAERIGPVRSARSTDVPILASLEEPLFAWSGSNAQFAALIREQNIVDVGVDAALDAYERDDERAAPSNLFTSSEALYAAAGDAGEAPRSWFRFRTDPDEIPLVARDVLGLTVDYGATQVTFTWDEARGVWLREQNGTPHVDTEGEQIAAANVIVQFVSYRQTDIVDSSGAPVPEAELIGRSDAFILVDGRLIQGVWSRPPTAPDGPTEYQLVDGTPVGLAPGSTWILLAEFGTVSVDEDIAAQQGG